MKTMNKDLVKAKELGKKALIAVLAGGYRKAPCQDVELISMVGTVEVSLVELCKAWSIGYHEELNNRTTLEIIGV